LLQKCKKIINTLHFKTELLESELLTTNDAIPATELLDKISDIKAVLDADEQTVSDDVDAEDMTALSDAPETSESDQKHQQPMPRTFQRLQNEVPTRWNSSLHMIDSILYLQAEVSNALKRTGH